MFKLSLYERSLIVEALDEYICALNNYCSPEVRDINRAAFEQACVLRSHARTIKRTIAGRMKVSHV
jgi:hypothetical protein